MPILRTLEFRLWIQCVSRHNSVYLSHTCTSYWCRSMILKWHDSVDWVLHNHRFNGHHIHSHSLRLTQTHMQTRLDRLARLYIESCKQFWKACHARYKREDFDAKHDTHTQRYDVRASAHPLPSTGLFQRIEVNHYNNWIGKYPAAADCKDKPPQYQGIDRRLWMDSAMKEKAVFGDP